MTRQPLVARHAEELGTATFGSLKELLKAIFEQQRLRFGLDCTQGN